MRSTARATPSTVSGQAIRPSSDSSLAVRGRSSCSIAVSAPGARSASPVSEAASWGSAAASAAVSTRAKTRGFWSHPEAATWRSVSRAATASGSVVGVGSGDESGTKTMLPYGRSGALGTVASP